MSSFYQEDTVWLRDLVPYNEQELLELTSKIQNDSEDIQTLILKTLTGVRYIVYPPALTDSKESTFYYTTLPTINEIPYARKLNFYTWEWIIETKQVTLDLWQYYLATSEEEVALAYLVAAHVVDILEVNCTYQNTITTWDGRYIVYEDVVVDQNILDLVLVLRPRSKIIWKYTSYPKKPVPSKFVEYIKNSKFSGGIDKYGYFLSY